MNKVKKLLVAMALMLAFPVFGEKDIEWDGEWENLPSHSLSSSIIGEIDKESKTLTLEFLNDVGDVVVSIVDASGNILYQEWVQTGITPSITLSLKGLKNSGGTVSVTDGESLIFEIINF